MQGGRGAAREVSLLTSLCAGPRARRPLSTTPSTNLSRNSQSSQWQAQRSPCPPPANPSGNSQSGGFRGLLAGRLARWPAGKETPLHSPPPPQVQAGIPGHCGMLRNLYIHYFLVSIYRQIKVVFIKLFVLFINLFILVFLLYGLGWRLCFLITANQLALTVFC